MVGAVLIWIRRQRWSKPYQPAISRIEGGGIKRGLTPPEGAVLLGRPLNLTLTLVIFEMLRKGFLRQETATPLHVTVAEGFRTQGSGLSAQARGDLRRQAAQTIHAALHLYEEPFLEIIEASPSVPVHKLDLGVAVRPLVRYVAGRVAGYSLEETRAYYHLIIERAPREARSDGRLTFERQKVFDRNFGWLLLGEDFAGVLDQPDYSYVPRWMRDPVRIPMSDVQSPMSESVSTRLPEGLTFAHWSKEIIKSIEGLVDESDVKLKLGDDTDATTATLMNDIGRATFFG
ncbi:MAG: hypothetical protein WD740_02830 [Anaerolineales bacterium]